ncbi:DUF4304 domain-containing protein [Paenibacillus sp. GSMTC-2017]|uniref:DUF4304 domain-containing protein n=1 Tax=Paenibacillus sp. GSMTC-2017 TaxID=2794350 RepID=UPI0018D8BDA0|nr:DUF4304 domain-containing protein [Paenibacillus sp. GSMTC-2017]MBH5320273.1 DUF4304 domain-containing protein [Paenibacillus sp. GSMTC-2017]
MIGSAEINKVIREIITPVLKQNGLTKVQTRNNWGWHNDCIWVLHIRSVGNYFSLITGWTPSSIVVEIGIYYAFILSEQDIKADNKARLLPKVHECHIRTELTCSLDQSNYTKCLENPTEKRTDIWWIEPDGSNIEVVGANIRDVFLEHGLSWFEKFTDLREAFSKIEEENNSYNKFYKAKYFAQHINDLDKFKEYSMMLEECRG